MERKGDDLKEKDLEQALAHLERAETDLKTAESAEEAAEIAEKAATHDIHEALQEIKEAEEHHHEIRISVDGEWYETERREMTPNEIIQQYGLKDPATNYLVHIGGGQTDRDRYQGKGDEPIKLHNDMKFMIVSTGPKTVSDGPIRIGTELFLEGLRALGYVPSVLPGRPDHVVFEYQVETGRFAGRKVMLGLIVPQDFPMTPPTGPHVTPHIHPINPVNGAHPTCGVHQTHSQGFEAGAGDQWQYWSRPYPQWGQSGKRTTASYMNHVWQLWDSQ